MKTFPTLYKKTSTGSIQTWAVKVIGTTMHSESGKLNGRMILTKDTIKTGKNIGRSNETTPQQQAILEAEARWTKKKKGGYVESLKDAEAGKTSKLVEGGYLPMLAKVYEKDGHHIKFPCAAQPKLDGIRATYSGGESIWSRTRKELKGVPHVPKLLVELLKDGKISSSLTDGELYNHALKDNFEKITHIVKQTSKPTDDYQTVEYHIYDLPSELPFSERMKEMAKLDKILSKISSIKIVETIICKNKEELMKYHEECLDLGYEGIMARNLDSPYEFKRSKHLQKIKIFNDAEFPIIGMNEGRGKLAGSCGSFICTHEGRPFDVKLKGKLSELKKYWENQSEYIGKQMTVQYQGFTGKNNVPRIPIGLRIREEL